MKLYPESKKIHEIFPIAGNVEYFIPIYQRSYSWRNDNIETLFNDIADEKAGYYIGNLLITPHVYIIDNSKEIADNRYDIVDGQQRLTTLALFLLAIYEILSEKAKNIADKESEIYANCLSYKSDIKRQLLKNGKKVRLNLLEDDQNIFSDLLEILDDNNNYIPHRNRVFGKRYKYIKELFDNKFFSENTNSAEEGLQELISYYEKLLDIEILRIEVSDLSDAFSIFTSFNAKGLPLTLIDLLKSYYLRNAEITYEPEIALNNWDKLIEIFHDKDGEPISNLVTQFLQNFYDTFESNGTSSITKSEALKKYEKLFASNGANYIKVLTRMGNIFSSFTNRVDEENFKDEYSEVIKEKLNTLYQLESSSLYPLLLFLLKNLEDKKIDEENVNEILDYCIKYFVRRNIVLKPKSSNMRGRVLQSVRNLEKIEDLNKDALSEVRKNLNSIAASDEEFKSSLKGDVYETNKATTRKILFDIESKNTKYFDKQYPNNLNAKNSKGNYIWTLEHIMPQSNKLSESWIKAICDGENLEKEKILQVHRENIHKLGNLTFTGYNSEMSNKDFTEKLNYKDPKTSKEVGLKTDLFLNKYILELAKKNDNPEWKVKNIEERTNILTELAIKMYSIF